MHNEVNGLSLIVSILTENRIVNNDHVKILNNTLSKMPGVVTSLLISQNQGKKFAVYTAELRSFAIPLKFYSRKAYDYVHEKFN